MTKKSAAAKNDKTKSNTDILAESYDELPYESYSYAQTHPERMFTIASLFQMNPPDFRTARVLEIGCAGGGNLIPVAILNPEAQCLGFDLSKEQADQAERSKKAMGLKNVEFRQMDVTKFPKEAGTFDYIICHGVFSWVPDFVRDSIFELCRNHLSAKGLAIISYNVLPGWGPVKTLRDMMIFHTNPFKDAAQKVDEARKFLNFVHDNASGSNETYRQIIDRERDILKKTNDTYLFHEHLELENHQFYLHEFANMAEKYGLTYVSDTELPTMYIGNLNAKVQETLGQIRDLVRQEQYIDFLTNRRFRHSIITRRENAGSIKRNIDHAQIFNFFIQAKFKPETDAIDETGKMTFKSTLGSSTITANDKDGAHIMQTLSESERPVTIEVLATKVHKKHGVAPEVTRGFFLQNGMPFALQGFITLHSESDNHTRTPGNKPKAFEWSRFLASQKITSGVTSLRRETVNLSPFHKILLHHLDGTKTREDLVELMVGHAMRDELKIMQNNVKMTEEPAIRAFVNSYIDSALKLLADHAFLME